MYIMKVYIFLLKYIYIYNEIQWPYQTKSGSQNHEEYSLPNDTNKG